MSSVATDIRPRVIVGLGNPGGEYAGTRHNAGFLVIDRILTKLRKPAETARRWDCDLARVTAGGRALLFAKPLTFMNLSGDAVARIRAAEAVEPAEILVVCDCLDLPLGRLRMRTGGGSGGHRGVESIIQTLGADTFPRLRVGIGRSEDTAVVKFVLGGWSEDERPIIDEAVNAAADAVILALKAGVDTAMNRFNGWRAKSAETSSNPKPAGEPET